MNVVGVDVSKQTLDIGVTVSGRGQLKKCENRKRTFPALLKWAQKASREEHPTFCLENTGRYGERLADWLFGQGCKVHMVNPVRIKAYARSVNLREKTDESDALLIGRFAEQNDLEPYTPTPDNQRELHGLNQFRQNLVIQKTRLSNQLGSLLDEPYNRSVVRQLKNEVKRITELIRQVEKEIVAVIAANEGFCKVIQHLLSIPGIGPVTAPILLEYLLKGFRSGKAMAQHAGLVPVAFRSGTSVRRRDRISKISDADLRTALYMPAVSVICGNSPFATFYNNLISKGKPRMVALVAVMRKLLCVAYGIFKHNMSYDPTKVLAHA